jgi:hypothetical protein
MAADQRQLRSLIDAYLEGELPAEQLAELSRRLAADPAARAEYWAAANAHAALKLWGEQQSGRAFADVLVFGEPPRRVSRWGGRALPAWVAVAAALALIASGWWLFRNHQPAGGALRAPAEITYTGDALWGHAGPANGGTLALGEHYLRTGMVRFETAAGAAVSVAGPTRFRIVAADRIELTSGRLTARMLSDAARLTVVAGGMEVTDLGTSFGVDAANSGRTLVSVFDGSVAVKNSSGRGQELRLAQGESVITSAAMPSAAPAAYDPHAFRDLWPLTVGIHEATNFVEFLPPGPMLRPLREYRADGKLFLLPEQQKAINDRRIPIDLSPEAPAWPDSPVSPYPLEPDVRVSSYLLFFQPDVGEKKGLRHLRGRITFHRRVLGVICSDQGLLASDGVMGLEGVDYNTPGQRRGLEEADKENYRGALLPHDSIKISADGRTVEFDFHVASEREQMRILVAADEPLVAP